MVSLENTISNTAYNIFAPSVQWARNLGNAHENASNFALSRPHCCPNVKGITHDTSIALIRAKFDPPTWELVRGWTESNLLEIVHENFGVNLLKERGTPKADRAEIQKRIFLANKKEIIWLLQKLIWLLTVFSKRCWWHLPASHISDVVLRWNAITYSTHI